jgi:hypothetical protein
MLVVTGADIHGMFANISSALLRICKEAPPGMSVFTRLCAIVALFRVDQRALAVGSRVCRNDSVAVCLWRVLCSTGKVRLRIWARLRQNLGGIRPDHDRIRAGLGFPTYEI